MSSFDAVSVDSSVCRTHGYGVRSAGIEFGSLDLHRFADVGNRLADAAGDVIRKYFRKRFDIHDKEDLSPVTIADQAAEESMVQIIQENWVGISCKIWRGEWMELQRRSCGLCFGFGSDRRNKKFYSRYGFLWSFSLLD